MFATSGKNFTAPSAVRQPAEAQRCAICTRRAQIATHSGRPICFSSNMIRHRWNSVLENKTKYYLANTFSLSYLCVKTASVV
jgi:hypothetical protein